jgi:arginase
VAARSRRHCSALIGAALALRRRGRYGLVFIDGHLDFRHLGNTERLSAVAGEDLAIVTGRGLDEHANLDRLRPYFLDEDVVAVGEREHDPSTSDILSTEITVLNLEQVRRNGPKATANAALDRLADARDGYWVHLDVDVLDSEVMSAVDSPQPDGLRVDELVSLLQELRSSVRMCGLDLMIYDPELDPDRTQAALVNRLLIAGLKGNPEPS